MRRSLDSNLIPAAIFLDVKKAFDCLTHNILIGKLCHVRFRGEALSWFSSHLTNRSIATEATDEKFQLNTEYPKVLFLSQPSSSSM